MVTNNQGKIEFREFEFHYNFIRDTDFDRDVTLLLGGVLQDRCSWKNYAREFSKYNDVLIVDLPGIGESGILDSNFGFDFLADCVDHLLKNLNLQKINLFSTSYSTIIAFEFAKKYAYKLNRLAISSSMTHIPTDQLNTMLDCLSAIKSNNLQSFSNSFLRGIANTNSRPLNSELVSRVIEQGIKQMTNTQKHQFCENTKRVLTYHQNFIPPTMIDSDPLIFTGELDTFTPPHLCSKIGAFFKNSYFRVIPNLDHFFHIGNNKLIFSAIIPYFTQGIIPDFEELVTNEKCKVVTN